MAISDDDVISPSQAHANLSELANQVKADADHLLLIDDASKGLADVAAGKVKDAQSTLSAIKRRRAAKATG